MLAIMNSLNAHNFPIFEPILMILVSKFMVYRILSDKKLISYTKTADLASGPKILIFHICIHCGKTFSNIPKYITLILAFDLLFKCMNKTKKLEGWP